MIKYLCSRCEQDLGCWKTGMRAVNEVGRKQCSRCGCNEDCLYVVGETEFLKLCSTPIVNDLWEPENDE